MTVGWRGEHGAETAFCSYFFSFSYCLKAPSNQIFLSVLLVRLVSIFCFSCYIWDVFLFSTCVWLITARMMTEGNVLTWFTTWWEGGLPHLNSIISPSHNTSNGPMSFPMRRGTPVTDPRSLPGQDGVPPGRDWMVCPPPDRTGRGIPQARTGWGTSLAKTGWGYSPLRQNNRASSWYPGAVCLLFSRMRTVLFELETAHRLPFDQCCVFETNNYFQLDVPWYRQFLVGSA